MRGTLWPDGTAAAAVRVDGQLVLAQADVSGIGAGAVLAWVAGNDWPALFPGCAVGASAPWWRERLADPADPLDLFHLRPVAWELAAQILSVPWWAARRLARQSAANWFGFSAWAAANGVRVADATGPDAVLAAVWAWRCDTVTATDAKAEAAARKALVRSVFDPPGTRAGAEAPVERAARLAANNTLLAQLTGGAPARGGSG